MRLPGLSSSSAPSRRFRAHVLLSVASLTLLVGVLVQQMLASWHAHRHENLDRALTLASAVRSHADMVVDSVAADVTSIARAVGREPELVTGPPEALAAKLAALFVDGQIAVIAVFDATGEPVAASRFDGTTSIPSDPQRRPVLPLEELEAHRQDPSPTVRVSRPFHGTLVDAELVAVSGGLRAPDGRFLGMVAAAIPVGRLLALFPELRPLPGMRMALLRGDGVRLVRHAPAGAPGPVSAPDDPLLRLLVEGPSRDARMLVSPLDGARVNIAYDRSARHPIVAVLAVPEAELWRAWSVRNRWTAAANLLLVLAALAANFYALSRVGRSLASTRRDLRSSERRFRDGIENMRDGFALWDRDDRLVAANRRCRELYPMLGDAMVPGARFADLARMVERHFAPESSDAAVERAVRGAIAAHRGAAGERIAEWPNGPVLAVTEAPTDDGGIISTYRDISVERRALRELAASEALFRDAIQSISEGFVLWSRDDRLVTWNQRVLQVLPHLEGVLEVGMTLEAYYAAAVARVRPEWSAEETARWKAARFASRRRFARTELRISESCIVEAQERPLSDGGVVTIYRDVTEERRLVEALRESEARLLQALAAERETNAEQRRFVAIASHEFRTPLAIIDGATQRLESRLTPLEPDVAGRLQRIRAAVARMVQIIERTLSSARLDGGRMETHWESVDLARLVREVCEREAQVSARFEFAIGGADAPLPIDGDPRLLEQVVANLLSNAVKYSGASRRVEVDVRRNADDVEIAVADAGLGIPADEIGQIFTRFYRARTAQGISGTGIGLHLVRELVSLHGGEVSVASTLGKGSTFTVRLPLARGMPLSGRRAA